MSASIPPALSVIRGRWRITGKVGQGAFGEIYAGEDLVTNEPVAVKVEKWDSKKSVLKLEVSVLRRLQDLPTSCKYIHCGHVDDYNYVVMELLGENLSELRHRQPDLRFSPSTSMRLGIGMLHSIRNIHDQGYLHRDIKPSNFAIGLSGHRRRQVVMIDFGLARKYRTPNGDIRPPREVAGFRGTARYASINSHLSKELSRRDDLWSLFYVLIEFWTGALPWRKKKNKEEMGLLKIQINNQELVKGMPAEFSSMMQYLQSMAYEDTPDYSYLENLMRSVMKRENCRESDLYDWEYQDATEFSGARTIKDDSAQHEGVSGGGKLITSYDGGGDQGTPFGSYRGQGMFSGSQGAGGGSRTPKRNPQPPLDPPPNHFGRGVSVGSALSTSPGYARQVASRSYEVSGVSPLYSGGDIYAKRGPRPRPSMPSDHNERIYNRPVRSQTAGQPRTRLDGEEAHHMHDNRRASERDPAMSLNQAGRKSSSRCTGCAIM
uniref:Protein kinase domain-containing protein n=2 Tax=Palpitomonas bilix TaxID=652834 RepID=A0A7S3GKX4_9EUKA|mmetsp:Transcript_7825/g.20326  ORF Transcript_7825/g.20326 Transcript_7825/m.20326 type:complete len:490 (+) Transcript_7825:228-1697(+)|eukprot:CAMPEP_0113868620 /NCGR_PEP_ID=MMETSP0780_2-20120614/1090_1 /TAXON_ID=652834 /ORGANISM="Palpitomonas bilix" /LENGTH=489 /DNA_ID=CAMNT_0000853723 /DNA_START=191 /DNA_END=1660 /DNA_ORIENTATION=- /assembly_acc=CAM_ASM_000599